MGAFVGCFLYRLSEGHLVAKSTSFQDLNFSTTQNRRCSEGCVFVCCMNEISQVYLLSHVLW